MNEVVTEANMYHFSSMDVHTNSLSLSLINEEIDFYTFPSLICFSLFFRGIFVVQDKNRLHLLIVNDKLFKHSKHLTCIHIY